MKNFTYPPKHIGFNFDLRSLYRDDVNSLCSIFNNWLARKIADTGEFQFYEFRTAPEHSRISNLDMMTRIIVSNAGMICYDMEPMRFEELSSRLDYHHWNTNLPPAEEDEWGPTRKITWLESHLPRLRGDSDSQISRAENQRLRFLRELNFMASKNRFRLRKWREQRYLVGRSSDPVEEKIFRTAEEDGSIFTAAAENILSKTSAAEWIEFGHIEYWIRDFLKLECGMDRYESKEINSRIFTELYNSPYRRLG